VPCSAGGGVDPVEICGAATKVTTDVVSGIGCGIGAAAVVAASAPNRGCTITAIDYSQSIANRAYDHVVFAAGPAELDPDVDIPQPIYVRDTPLIGALVKVPP